MFTLGIFTKKGYNIYMEIVLNFDPLLQAADKGVFASIWFLLSKGLWIVLVWIIFKGIYAIWLMKKQGAWFSKHKFTILAIDIPKDTEQTPKAVEQLFATVSGAHAPLSPQEIKFEGKFQLSFSFEIVSIDGYIQFLVRTPSQFKNVIETSIYAQYPDAEITEVEDYVTGTPEEYPNDTHQIWGTEVVPVAPDVLPFRTYPYFEDAISGEFKDPLASVLETMSKIHIGEQVWIQIIVKPTDRAWTKKSQKMIYKIAGKDYKSGGGGGMLTKGIDWTIQKIDDIGEMGFPLWGDTTSKKEKSDLPSLMLHLTPGEKTTIQAIENKASKIGFDCKIRLVYISPKDDFMPPRVVSPVFGAIKQYAALDLNAFKPCGKTKTKIDPWYMNLDAWWVKYKVNIRRGNLIKAYKGRSGVRGGKYFIMNTEELASLWHFPSKYIKTPLLQKTEVKKAGAPISLPTGEQVSNKDESLKENLRQQLKSEEVYTDLDNEYFEDKFAKEDKKTFKHTDHKGKPPTNLPTS